MFRTINILGSSPIRSFKTTITAANFKTLFSSPIQLLAAQGANKYIAVIANTVAFSKAVGTAYTFGANRMVISYSSNPASADYVYNFDDSVFNAAGAITYMPMTVDEGIGISAAAGVFVNQGLYLANAGADSAAGTGSVKLAFNYCVIDIS